MSSVGKRPEGRGQHTRKPAHDHRITYNPRPHIDISLNKQTVQALLDPGSELSFINQEVLSRAEGHGFHPEGSPSTAQLADGTITTLPGTITLPIVWEGRVIRHRFRVMPALKSPVLIGVDLWAKIGLDLPAPPIKACYDPPTRNPIKSQAHRAASCDTLEIPRENQANAPINAAGTNREGAKTVTGLAVLDDQSRARLAEFLKIELAKFEEVREPLIEPYTQ